MSGPWVEGAPAQWERFPPTNGYVCPQCGPDPAGPAAHTRSHHTWHGGGEFAEAVLLEAAEVYERDRLHHL